MSWVALGVATIGAVSSFASAKKAEKKARRAKKKQEAKLAALEANRQEIINPYEGASDLSGMIQDLSGSLTNPYANLSVATQAAEIQIEEADLSLANTLDTLRATGSGSGGATALAQAAMKSKKGVAASIESQEATNERMRAEGEAKLESLQMAEKKRLQQAQFGEAGRMQNIDAQGKLFMFNQRENRQKAQLNRTQSMADQAAAYEAAARADSTAAVTGYISTVGGMAASGALGGGSTPQVSSVTGLQSSGITNVPSGSGASGASNLTPGLFTTHASPSDRRLKKNIKLIGKSPKGINIYAFEYINKIFGNGIWQGVMSDEIPQEAVIKHIDGYDRVDYSKLDVEFKNI